MVTTRARFVSFLPLALLCACSAFGVTATQSPSVLPFGVAERADEARVCVMRGGALPAPFFTTVVYDNTKLVGATRDGTYFCYFAQPGKHVIVSDGTYGARTAVLTATPGGRYYLKQTWLFPPVVRGHALSWIDESVARNEIESDEYAVLTEVPGDTALPGDKPFAPASAR